jgi:hypothetical protein
VLQGGASAFKLIDAAVVISPDTLGLSYRVVHGR